MLSSKLITRNTDDLIPNDVQVIFLVLFDTNTNNTDLTDSMILRGANLVGRTDTQNTDQDTQQVASCFINVSHMLSVYF